jgi:alpha-L-arabinofuranosidase
MNSAEFKDVVVTSPEGKVLYKPDFNTFDAHLRQAGNGDWSAKDGVLKQSAIAPGVAVFMGDTTWRDYTITLKARMISGENGFQIFFRNKDNNQRSRWEIGGWGNSTTQLEMGMATVDMKRPAIKGQWYDVKIEISGNNAKGYLDGELIQKISDETLAVKSLIMSSVVDSLSGDVILKVVNASAKAVKTEINLKDAKNLKKQGTAIVLTSNSPLDENTLEEPRKVYPKTEKVKISGTSCIRTFPGNSLTVIRFEK